MISIVIPAYNSSSFIEECIASIKNSITNIQYQILLGIDNCEETLAYINNNKEIFKGIDVFYFERNVGPYVIKNTLSSIAEHQKILFFDSDDVMCEHTIEEFGTKILLSDFIKLTYQNFDTVKENIGAIESEILSDAVIGIDKEIFKKLNGFYPWRCAGDSEFEKRLGFNGFKSDKLGGVSYYRRVHSNNLTVRPETNFKSKIREEYRNILKQNSIDNNWPNPEEIVTEKYTKIEL
jgi:glycosyltransferase involved in cell wall biosynthesis